jgi:hypothetical protein
MYLSSCHQTMCEQTSETELLATVKLRLSTISADRGEFRGSPRAAARDHDGRALCAELPECIPLQSDTHRRAFDSQLAIIKPAAGALWFACPPPWSFQGRTPDVAHLPPTDVVFRDTFRRVSGILNRITFLVVARLKRNDPVDFETLKSHSNTDRGQQRTATSVGHMRFLTAGLTLFFILQPRYSSADDGSSARDFTSWTTGSGSWTDAKHWSNGVPDGYHRTEVHGASNIVVHPGTNVLGDLEVGLAPHDRARVEVDGGQLILLQDSLRIGEETESEGEFVLKDGAMHCFMDVYVGAANGVPGRSTKAALRIHGGSFLGRTLLVGLGWGAESALSIEGSKASVIHVLDYAHLEAHSDTNGKPGNTTLEFTIDEHGVTPISIQARYRGLQIVTNPQCHCRLKINLAAVPPRDNITLVTSHVPIQGAFDELPEGAEIACDFAGHRYQWNLTYRGGPQGHDLVLLNKSTYVNDAPVTHTRSLPSIPKPLWTEHRLYPLSNETPGQPAFQGAEGFGSWTPGGLPRSSINNAGSVGHCCLRGELKGSLERQISYLVESVRVLRIWPRRPSPRYRKELLTC